MAQAIARSHHERWDGGGYPDGLAGLEIPECARIVAIVDVFDAISHDRVYRPAFSDADVLRMMRDGRGTHFEPRLLDCFLSMLPRIRRLSKAHPDGTAWDESPLSPGAFSGTNSLCPHIESGVPVRTQFSLIP